MEQEPEIHPLKQAREQLGLDEGQLATKIGLLVKDAVYQIRLWEKGDRLPNYEAAKRLSSVLVFGSAEEVLQLCQEWRNKKENKGKDASTQDRS